MALDSLVEKAEAGDQAALEEIVRQIQDKIYALALRMLWHPEDAKDATQEILIRIITQLGNFKRESQFTTWVYRVASNYLLNARKSRVEQGSVSFQQFGQDLDTGLSYEPYSESEAEQRVLVEEVKIGCTLAMLLCLDRAQRVCYILGEIFELNSHEAAEILNISSAAFRQRLSRARKRIRDFMQHRCGIINPANRCRCAARIKPAIQNGRVDPDNLLFTGPNVKTQQPVAHHVREMETLERTAALYRSHPAYAAPDVFLENIRSLLASGDFQILG